VKTSREDIKQRFAAIEKTHLSKWDSSHAAPCAPHVTTVMRELRQGKARANARSLAKALTRFDGDRYGGVEFLEVVSTPSIQAHIAALKTYRNARAKFVEQLAEAKSGYLDRVLFDHESPFVLIGDFKTWHPRAARLSLVQPNIRKAA
jgi:predicted glycoside hydrolase/deacetylase ChbG (UPF0249 family)